MPEQARFIPEDFHPQCSVNTSAHSALPLGVARGFGIKPIKSSGVLRKVRRFNTIVSKSSVDATRSNYFDMYSSGNCLRKFSTLGTSLITM